MLKAFEVVCKIRTSKKVEFGNKIFIVRLSSEDKDDIKYRIYSPYVKIIKIYDVPDKRMKYIKRKGLRFTIL